MYKALLVTLLFCTPLLGLAWGEKGHATVGAIADKNLSDKARTAVSLLLRDDRTWNGQKSHRTTLAEVANWADEIKSDPRQNKKKPWHYHNNAVCTSQAGPCANGACISSKLQELIALLRDKAVPQRQRNEALKWIVHLVGDLHQPLHIGDNHDQGGNKVLVALSEASFNDAKNLHSAWDSDFVERITSFNVDRLAPLPAHFQDSDIALWANESRALARDSAYATLPGFACPDTSPRGVIMLPTQYQDAAAGIAQTRIEAAGVRLAAILNTVFED